MTIFSGEETVDLKELENFSDLFLHAVAGREMNDYLYRGTRGNHAWGWCGAGAGTG